MIVPGRPSSDALLWWHLGAWTPPTIEPAGPALQVHDLSRLAPAPTPTGPRLIAAAGLNPDTEYRLTVGSETCRSATFPTAVSPARPFRVSLGSCFYHDSNPGNSTVYDGLLRRAGPRIDLRFLCGDQLYMDLSDGLGSMIDGFLRAPDPWRKYLEQWQARDFPRFLAATPSVLQGDDHEFWNDFPHEKVWIRWADKSPTSPIQVALDKAYSAFQLSLNLPPAQIAAGATAADVDQLLDGPARSFAIDIPPLSFFNLDLRSRRTIHDHPVRSELARPADFQRAINWLANLNGPGVLVVPNPIVVGKASTLERVLHAKGDWALADYEEAYGRLMSALFAAPHDVMVLSGDIHWGRCFRIWQTEAGRKVYEVVSSPQRLLAGNRPAKPEDKNRREGKVEWRAPSGEKREAFWHNLMILPVCRDSTWATIEFRVPSLPSQIVVQATAQHWCVRQESGLAAEPAGEPVTMSLR
jgi:hypothetical protein